VPSFSAVYELFIEAMRSGKQVVCFYDGHAREICPVILGHTDGEEKALVYQFAGASSKSRVPDWKCFVLAKVSKVRLRDGPLLGDARHVKGQSCVKDVDVDINPNSPYEPRRQLKEVKPAAKTRQAARKRR
jgi:hypothetical protein